MIQINAGQSVGLVGQSGSGKSTFVNLVLRLYDPVQGRILLDGIDLRELDINELREQISYVPPNTAAFQCLGSREYSYWEFRGQRRGRA